MNRSNSQNDVVAMSEHMCKPLACPEELARRLEGQTWTVIPGRLSLGIHRDEEQTKQLIMENPSTFYFSSWMQESYEGFCLDFGPVNLAAVVRFCDFLHEKLLDPRLAKRSLIYYCDADSAYLTNTAFLLGAYLILVEKWSPERATRIFEAIEPCPFRLFRDATHSPSTFGLTLLDCFRGLQRAVDVGFFVYKDFNLENYEALDNPEVADAHFLCPKFLAFRGPAASPDRNLCTRNPEHYVPLFQELGVSAVVRLNEANTYNSAAFSDHGIHHHDLYFDDCTAPSEHVVRRFHELAAAEPGVVAVHCAAGLGRTGTLVGTWMMKHLGFSAREAIAWLRIVRPGSVIGPQQHFLEVYEHRLAARAEPGGPCSVAEAEAERLMMCSASHSKLLASHISHTPRRAASALGTG